MKRKSVFILMVLVSAFGLAGCTEEKKAAAPPPPPEVEVAEVIQKDVPVFSEWVASLDGMVNASILAQVQGYLIKQNYKEGDFVKKGALLFEIDPRPFQAAVDEARAGMAKQQAVLQTSQANLKRILPLAAANAVSQRDKDNAVGPCRAPKPRCWRPRRRCARPSSTWVSRRSHPPSTASPARPKPRWAIWSAPPRQWC